MDNNGNVIQWSNQSVDGFWRELKTQIIGKKNFSLKDLKILAKEE